MWRQRVTYEPRMSADERESLISRWHEAVARSRDWARP
jgi:glycerol kinase